MTDRIIDFAGERLIRRAPEWPLALTAGDQDYVLSSLRAIQTAFAEPVVPDVPLDLIPARALMRLLVRLRRTLRADTEEQRQSLTRLPGALHLLAIACALERERAAADDDQRAGPGGHGP
ncbi:MAG TPA: hypothetical protein VGE72_29920 [Azospirillum sp.]